MIRLLISKPKVKHTNNKITITIYTFNRKKVFYINKIKKLVKLYKTKRFALLASPLNLKPNSKRNLNARSLR